MSKILKTAAKNTVVVLVARGVSMLCSVAFIAMFSRYVGVEQFGQYAYVLSLATLFSGLVAFGLDAWAIREIAQSPERVSSIVGQALFVQASLALSSLLGLTLYWTRINADHQMLLIGLIVAGYMFLDVMGSLLISIFRAHERMEYETIAISVGNVVMVALVGVGILMHVGIIFLLSMVAVSYVIKFGIILYLARRKCGLTSVIRHSWPVPSQIRPALPFFFVAIGSNIHIAYPRLILGAAVGMQEVGLYAAAERVIALVTVFAGVLDVVIYPIFAKKIQANTQEFARTYKQVADLVMVMGLLLGIGLAGITPEVIAGLFGPQFKGSVPITILLIPTVSMSFAAYVNTRAVFALRQERLMSMVLITSAIIGAVTALAVVKGWGYTGVAFSYAITIGFGFVFYFVHIRRRLGLAWRTTPYRIYFCVFPAAFVVSYAARNLMLLPRIAIHGALIAVLVAVFARSGLLDWKNLIDLCHAFIPGRALGKSSFVQKALTRSGA